MEGDVSGVGPAVRVLGDEERRHATGLCQARWGGGFERGSCCSTAERRTG